MFIDLISYRGKVSVIRCCKSWSKYLYIICLIYYYSTKDLNTFYDNTLGVFTYIF